MVLRRGKDFIINKQHPEWGIWSITHTPTEDKNYYEIRGDSGDSILDPYELKRFWKKTKI